MPSPASGAEWWSQEFGLCMFGRLQAGAERPGVVDVKHGCSWSNPGAEYGPTIDLSSLNPEELFYYKDLTLQNQFVPDVF